MGPSKKGDKRQATAKQPQVQDALGYLEKVKNRFKEQPTVYNQFLDIMKDFKSQAINTDGVIERVKTLFKGNRQLILGFNQFLPPGYTIEPEPKPTIEFNHAVKYVAKIKERFKGQPEIYGEFLDILHEYQAKRTIDEVYARVQKLFGNQPDLLDEFKYFLPDNNAGGKRASKGKKASKKSSDKQSYKRRSRDGRTETKKPVPPIAIKEADKGAAFTKPGKRSISYPAGSEKELQLFEKIKASVQRPQWVEFLKCLNLFANDVISRTELVRMVDDVLGDKQDFGDKFRVAIGFDDWEERQLSLQNRSNYYAFVSSVDFSTCKEVTPSYRRLPEEIAIPPCSGRNTLSDNVLNDKCISIPTGSEDFSFKNSRKNIYEETLFKCEDERFELDMIIEQNAACIRVLEPIEREAKELGPEEACRIRLSDNVDILHIRAISRCYGERGYEVVELLKRSPHLAGPVILRRLRQKDEEWRRVRHEMKNQWRKITEQNYQRSLDHRSFYFKQEDKKRRSPKALVSELREVHMKVFGYKEDNDGSLGVSENLFPTQHSFNEPDEAESELVRKLNLDEPPLFTYCMRFKFEDQQIHEQVYEILSRVVQNQLSEDDQMKFHTFWVGFVHHMFNVEVPVASEGGALLQELPAVESEANDESAPTRRGRKKGTGQKQRTSERERLRQQQLQQVKEQRRQESGEAGAEMEDEEEGQEAEAKEGDDNEDEDDEGDEERPEARKKRKRAQPSSARKRHRRKKDMEVEESDSDAGVENGNVSVGVAKNVSPAIRLNWIQSMQDTGNKVKPVRVMMETFELEEKLNPVRRHARPSKLFIGNDPYYVFFRLHQLMYDRLLVAKHLANKHRNVTSKNKNIPQTPDGRWKRFKQMLYQLLDGELDTNRFEDECRILLTADSFMLFTMDKLVSQLIKQTQSLITNATCMRLLSLYQYERCRATRSSFKGATTEKIEARSAELARIYHSNCASLLGDDSCCQIELFEDTNELGIGLIDGFMVSEPNKPKPQEWSDYLESYLEEDPAIAAANAANAAEVGKNVFLTRNFARFLKQQEVKKESKGRKAKKGGAKPKPVEANDPVKDAMDNVEIHFGLEAKVCGKTFKLHFQDDTFDYFIRHVNKARWNKALQVAGDADAPDVRAEATNAMAEWRKQRAANRAARFEAKRTRFNTWLAARSLEFAPEKEEEEEPPAAENVDMDEKLIRALGAVASAATEAEDAEEDGGEGKESDGGEADDADAGAADGDDPEENAMPALEPTMLGLELFRAVAEAGKDDERDEEDGEEEEDNA